MKLNYLALDSDSKIVFYEGKAIAAHIGDNLYVAKYLSAEEKKVYIQYYYYYNIMERRELSQEMFNVILCGLTAKRTML